MSTIIPLDTSVRATYTDGFVLDETEQHDMTAYPHLIQEENPQNNTFGDILNKRPEAEHGPMVTFTVFYNDAQYDIDWTTLPANARPIRFRDFEMDDNGPFAGIKRVVGCRIGYQYNDKKGKNHKEVQEL